MNFAENTGVLIQALRFCSEKHRRQRRKDPAHTPYINHLIDVLQLLWEIGEVREVAVLAAALLHDTLEDTDTSPGEIAKFFGEQVMSLVQEVTDDRQLARAERKQLQIDSAGHKSHGAKLIKLADKCCNVRDLADSPPADWPLARRREYFAWTEQVVAGLRGTNPALESYYDRELKRGEQILGGG